VAVDTDIHSQHLPGGNFISALLNRQLMSFADRGGSSGLVGDRWADHCDLIVQEWAGGLSDVPGGLRPPIAIDRIARLDSFPSIARSASKRGLQNPDFIIIGDQEGAPAIQAADAKFSIETARSRQVSPEVLEALLELRDVLRPATGEIHAAATIEPGFFLTPDYPMTHYMLRRRNGIRRASVHEDEVEMIEIDAAEFFEPVSGSSLMPVLAEVDGLPVSLEESLMAGLYYFRISRAAIGCWLDSVKPLLVMGDRVEVNEDAVLDQAERRARTANSAYQLMLDWDADIERIRATRAAVDQVTQLPVVNRELRELILRVSDDLKIEAPSMNQVRRRLGAWFRGEIRDRVGPLYPPVENVPAVLQQLASISAELAPKLPGEAERIVFELGVEQADNDDIPVVTEATQAGG
jgi:hypothetical protein